MGPGRQTFYNRPSFFGRGLEEFQGREALNALRIAKVLILIIVAVDRGYLRQALEGFGSLFVGGGEVFTVAAWGEVS